MSKIDVIIPVYNGEDFIEEAIKSIQQQSFADFRIIVVDDGSTDNSAKKVKEMLKSDSRIILLQPGKIGLANALNFGLDNAEAPYIAFLDADDLWEKSKLEKQMKVFEKQNDISVCFTKFTEFESFKNTSENHKFKARKEPINGLVKITFLGKREVFKKYGNFNPKIELGDFVSWFSNLINAGCKYFVIPEVLVFRRIHDNNMTAKLDRKGYLDMIKAHLDAKKKK